FLVLLVGADRGQRGAVDDVRHRVVPALLTEVPGRLPPAPGAHAVLLAEQGQEDLGLVHAEPGQLAQPRQQLGTGLGARPHLARALAPPPPPAGPPPYRSTIIWHSGCTRPAMARG